MKIIELLNKYSKYIVWGTGNYYCLYKTYLSGYLTYFVDNDSKKWGTTLDGKKICGPESLRFEEEKDTLIIVCNNFFDEVRGQLDSYGNFDVIDILSIVLIQNHEVMNENGKEYEPQKAVMICAGIHALWQRNGARKFIDGQSKILSNHGYSTLEVAPVMYYRFGSAIGNYLIVSENGRYAGMFSIEEFVDCYPEVRAVIIHSLYYSYQILEAILSKVCCRKGVFYYLHDYFCICNYRFLFREEKLCIDDKSMLRCETCPEKKRQLSLQNFHEKVFHKYNVTLIAPSLDTKKRVEKFYPNSSVIEIPHLTYVETSVKRNEIHKKARVAFVGIAVWQKGWDGFCELVRRYGHVYEFFCLGDCEDKRKIKSVTYVSVELKNNNQLTMVQALRQYEIDIAYIGSILPETYSYTYFEAYEAGCFIITTTRSGNICDQVRKNRNGYVFESEDDLIAWMGKGEVYDALGNRRKIIAEVRDNESFMQLIE